MLAIRHRIPRVCAQITRPSIQLTQTRWNSTTPSQPTDEKKQQNLDQFDGILGVLGISKTAAEGEVLDSTIKTTTGKKTGTGFFDVASFTNTLDSMNQSPHQLHINATFNNTIITLTRPNGAPLVTTSGGSAGFKKAARSGYEAAHQAAIQLLEKMNAKNLQVPNIHIVLKGFGPGRDAAFKALVSGSPWNVKRITDATPIPFGGCRPKKARRL